MPSELATVDPLPGILWNAHAALGDAMQRAPMNAPLIVLWLDEAGVLKYSRSANNRDVVWLAHSALVDALVVSPNGS